MTNLEIKEMKKYEEQINKLKKGLEEADKVTNKLTVEELIAMFYR